MIRDFRAIDTDAPIEADICIVGAGAAGITLARALAGTGRQVCMLESGGFEFEPETQALYEGELAGVPYYPLDSCRLRYFGGTTGHWAGWCAPLGEMDFEPRPWIPYSGWPIRKKDLDPYYELAQKVVDFGPNVYDDRVWKMVGIDAPKLDPERLAYRFWQFSPPLRFGDAYRAELDEAKNVRVLLHANVTDIRASADGSKVEELVVRSLDGKRTRVRAGTYVLACGGIENARLLLLSNDVEPAGLGNRHDLVGRFFMEHTETRSGIVMATDVYPLLETFVLQFHDGVPFQPGICLSDRAQRRHGLMNASIRMDYLPDTESGTYAARELWHDLKEGRLDGELADKLWRVVTDLGDVGYHAWRKVVQGKNFIARPRLVYLATETEQVPDPDSRVTLIAEKDALGLNRVRLDWHVAEPERRTVDHLTRAVAVELGRLDLARVRLEDWLTDPAGRWGDDLQGAYHHIGTTRMADDPKQGVVDRNCRVHGMANLYVAGSSVFPTGGFANPTLSIVAMALRLADHLRAGPT